MIPTRTIKQRKLKKVTVKYGLKTKQGKEDLINSEKITLNKISKGHVNNRSPSIAYLNILTWKDGSKVSFCILNALLF